MPIVNSVLSIIAGAMVIIFSHGSVDGASYTALQTPSPVPILSPMPTIASNPTSTKKPTQIKKASKPIPSASANNIRDFIMDGVNNYRQREGLGVVKTDSFSCDFATIRAKESAANFSHDGFYKRIKSKTLPYPEYSLVTENLAMTTNYKDVVTLWINSEGHAANMRADTPYVCISNYGNYYAYEGWKSLR